MKSLLNVFLIVLFFATTSTHAFNPKTDGKDGVNNKPKVNKDFYRLEKVNFKDVKDLFRPKKRLERLFAPNKKSLKRKYTIA